MWVHDGTNGKLDGHSNEGVWVGYDQDSTHAHRIYWPGKRTVSVERNVKFDSMPFTDPIPPVDMPVEGEHEARAVNQPIDKTTITKPTFKSSDEPAPDPIPSRTSSPIPEERPKRAVKPSAYVTRLRNGEGTTAGVYKSSGHPIGPEVPVGVTSGDAGAMVEYEEDIELGNVEFAMVAAVSDAEGLEPRTLEEAKGRSDWPMWEEATAKEMGSLEAAKTWEIVERPSGKNIVGCKLVFRIKKDSQGHIQKYKARLVARGFTQVYGVDYIRKTENG